ncbi:MAG: sigma factor-like helix-turn-helix DNA-binding protein [Kofleriaceae bacterium]
MNGAYSSASKYTRLDTVIATEPTSRARTNTGRQKRMLIQRTARRFDLVLGGPDSRRHSYSVAINFPNKSEEICQCHALQRGAAPEALRIPDRPRDKSGSVGCAPCRHTASDNDLRYCSRSARSAPGACDLLEREIDALPEGLRSVLVLRDVVELDTAETAARLGIQDDNVRVRLHRARLALAQRVSAIVQGSLDEAPPEVWRFDGECCARILASVMARIADSIRRARRRNDRSAALNDCGCLGESWQVEPRRIAAG